MNESQTVPKHIGQRCKSKLQKDEQKEWIDLKIRSMKQIQEVEAQK